MYPEDQKVETYHPFFLFNKQYKNLIIAATISISIMLFSLFFWSAPENFPIGSIYDLKSGQTLSVVANNFYASNIVRSNFWFKSFVYLFSFGHAKVIEGNYALYKKENILTLAWRVTHGQLNIIPVKVTIPEGLNSFEIADIFSNNFSSFDKDIFLNLVTKENLEGYLFPDTYFLLPNVKEKEIIKIMNDNFNEKVKGLDSNIKKSGYAETDVIKMASILEEEARTDESKKIIAGILWKRIELGMALQIDSSFKYINGKTTKNLSVDDLKIDSPYNSYIHRGLPPTPISNPGLASIMDAITPTKTPYLYFLTDSDGNMHYAVTFEEHVANKLKYLR